MIEELKELLSILGNISEISLWVLGSFISYKIISIILTTGSIVYVLKLGIVHLFEYLKKSSDADLEKKKIAKQNVITDVDIMGLCITSDGTYESVVNSLKKIKNHVNTAGGHYLHYDAADWLKQAIDEKIEREQTKLKIVKK